RPRWGGLGGGRLAYEMTATALELFLSISLRCVSESPATEKPDPEFPGDRVMKSQPHYRLLRLYEEADKARRALRVAGKLGLQLRQREPCRQFLGVEIGRDHHVRVVMRRAGWRARPGKEADALGALAADILVGLLADFALRERSHVRRNAVRHPVE